MLDCWEKRQQYRSSQRQHNHKVQGNEFCAAAIQTGLIINVVSFGQNTQLLMLFYRKYGTESFISNMYYFCSCNHRQYKQKICSRHKYFQNNNCFEQQFFFYIYCALFKTLIWIYSSVSIYHCNLDGHQADGPSPSSSSSATTPSMSPKARAYNSSSSKDWRSRMR